MPAWPGVVRAQVRERVAAGDLVSLPPLYMAMLAAIIPQRWCTTHLLV